MGNRVDGVWDIFSILGATVRIKSMGISNNLFGGVSSGAIGKVVDVQFRVTSDGKATTLISLDGYESLFKLENLEFIKLDEDGGEEGK